ncbi:MAG TPA: hypothetical protein VF708_13520 [Pyrinomonadaceae bacterium]
MSRTQAGALRRGHKDRPTKSAPPTPLSSRKSTDEMMMMMKRFLQDETGLELSEYAVAAALVTLAVVAVFGTLGTNINNVISNLASFIK